MSERKNKVRAANDNVAHTSRHLSRTSSDYFVNLFLSLCEEYDVTPLPRVLPLDFSPTQISSSTARKKVDHKEVYPTKFETSQIPDEISAPVIRVTYGKSKEQNHPEKIECAGHEISVCMLDAVSSSIEKFRTLTTIRFRNCRINAFGVSQIGRMLTEIGCIRDLNLDMNPNIRQNYHLLCSPAGNLHYLSLKYCDISDDGLEKITKELKYKENEVPQLIGLNLANNRITDVGAGHIAKMLRTNRSLQSLILAGNGITDVGAALIIEELCMYPLTDEEIVDLRRLNYKILLSNSIDKSQESIPSQSRNSSRNSLSKKNSKTRKITGTKKLTNDKREIQSLKKNPMDSNLHPFVAECSQIKGEIMAAGNFELQHLNLGYNHLTDETLKKMIQCLFYQSYVMLKDPSKGLLHVTLEGNDFQIEGNENSNQLHELLRNRVSTQNSDEVEK